MCEIKDIDFFLSKEEKEGRGSDPPGYFKPFFLENWAVQMRKKL